MKFKVFILSLFTFAGLSVGFADEVAPRAPALPAPVWTVPPSTPPEDETIVDPEPTEPESPEECTLDVCPIGVGKVITVPGGG